MNERLLIAYIDGRRVAMPAPAVHSIIEIDSVKPVPLAPPHMVGITAMRSRTLSVIDCRLALGFGSGLEKGEQAIVVERGGHAYALLVDCADDVADQLSDPAAPPGALGPGWDHIGRGMVETSLGPALLVDIDCLVAGVAAEAA